MSVLEGHALMRSLGRAESGVGGSASLWPAAEAEPLEPLGGDLMPWRASP